MRPRVFPAEDFQLDWNSASICSSFNEAAGIPRGRLSTRLRCRWCAVCFNEAAGIPRGRPSRRRRRRGGATRFNEAAGIPRGRLTSPPPPGDRRPRFNEAAGIPRGRRPCGARSARSSAPGFNEAAGIPRGRRDKGAGVVADFDASMRPRVFPAEDDRKASIAFAILTLQ